MKTKAILECVLFFLIGFQAIDVALAAYVKMSFSPAENWIAVIKPVLELPPDIVPLESASGGYSEVVYVIRTGPARRLQSQVFSGKEMGLLTALARRTDKKGFADFMATSFVVSRSAFMESVAGKLQAPELIAKNEDQKSEVRSQRSENSN